jgi:hypothetical protein
MSDMPAPLSKDLLVVLGMMGRTPFAGVAWQVLQYLEGLRRLGYDVYYVEDTGDWPYDADRNTVTDDCTYTVKYIARLMDWCGFQDHWAYRSGVDGTVHGLSECDLLQLYEEALVLVNLTGATILRDEHLHVPVRIFLETDPVLPQIEVARGRAFTIEMMSAHTHHFTFGENLGAPDCLVPVGRFAYRPTRQPIILEWWNGNGSDTRSSHLDCFTTIGSWQQSGKDVEWNGEMYRWSKHHEFLRFLDLPRLTAQPFELALALDDEPTLELLLSYGWRVTDAIPLSKDIYPYRRFISGSRGEFTVAKDQNIRLRSGWFSDRSASYLAAGRPVITQDTAFPNTLPTGTGLFAFNTMEDILTAIDAINGAYTAHSNAARDIAGDCFAAEKVLSHLMAQVGV